MPKRVQQLNYLIFVSSKKLKLDLLR